MIIKEKINMNIKINDDNYGKIFLINAYYRYGKYKLN